MVGGSRLKNSRDVKGSALRALRFATPSYGVRIAVLEAKSLLFILWEQLPAAINANGMKLESRLEAAPTLN